MSVQVSLKELIESGAHFGHQTRRWNPKMSEFLYGSKEGVHIFDLTKTKERLEEALGALKNAAKQNKSILIIGTKKQARNKVEEIAKAAGVFYINERWLGGILTNFEQIKKSIMKLEDMKAKMQQGAYSKYTKKERLLLDREIKRLERFFAGISDMKKPPEVMVIIDIKKESGAVREAKARGVETIGIVDSNSDPTYVDYSVPMNDDASKAIDYVLELMRDTILEGRGIKLPVKEKTEEKAVEEKKENKKEVKEEPKKSKSDEKKNVKTISDKKDSEKENKKPKEKKTKKVTKK